MEWDVGTATAGQIENSTRKVKSISLKARSTNASPIFIGRSDVGSGNGWELSPGESTTPIFDTGSKVGTVPFNVFYVSGVGQVDWQVILF